MVEVMLLFVACYRRLCSFGRGFGKREKCEKATRGEVTFSVSQMCAHKLHRRLLRRLCCLLKYDVDLFKKKDVKLLFRKENRTFVLFEKFTFTLKGLWRVNNKHLCFAGFPVTGTANHLSALGTKMVCCSSRTGSCRIDFNHTRTH